MFVLLCFRKANAAQYHGGTDAELPAVECIAGAGKAATAGVHAQGTPLSGAVRVSVLLALGGKKGEARPLEAPKLSQKADLHERYTATEPQTTHLPPLLEPLPSR